MKFHAKKRQEVLKQLNNSSIAFLCAGAEIKVIFIYLLILKHIDDIRSRIFLLWLHKEHQSNNNNQDDRNAQIYQQIANGFFVLQENCHSFVLISGGARKTIPAHSC